jgi:hypothetical protein
MVEAVHPWNIKKSYHEFLQHNRNWQNHKEKHKQWTSIEDDCKIINEPVLATDAYRPLLQSSKPSKLGTM